MVRDHHIASPEEFPALSRSAAESSMSQGRDGIFNRLRRRFSDSRHSSTSTSSVSAFNSEEVKRSDIIVIVQKTRASLYRCVPLPPGFIPSEEIMMVVHQDHTVYSAEVGRGAAEIVGTRNMQGENESQTVTLRENAVSPFNIPSRSLNALPDVLYNNWVDPFCTV